MIVFELKLTPAEVMDLVRSETRAALGAPELAIAAQRAYQIEEEFDVAAYGLSDARDVDLVKSIATLTVEPRVESGYWVLETVVERNFGPLPKARQEEMVPGGLSLDDFEAELESSDISRKTVRLLTQTTGAREEFERWLAEARERSRHYVRERKMTKSSERSDTRNLLLTTAAIWLVGAGVYFVGNSLPGAKPEQHESAAEGAAATHTAPATTAAPAAEHAAPAPAAPAPVAPAPAAAPVAATPASASDELLTLQKDPTQWEIGRAHV